MKKNSKYEELATNIVELIGGKENISYFAHCITRLRFTVKDKSRVQDEKIATIGSVVGVNWSGDQLQVIIGQAVGDAYRLICQKYDFELDEQVNEISDDAKKKKGFSFNKILEIVSGIVTPLISVLTVAGLLKMVVMLAETAGILSSDSSTYLVLSFAADAGFYFLPVMAGAYAAKKFGTNIALGMMMGGILIHPNFIEAISNGTALSIFGLPIQSTNYASTIVPVILVVAVMAPIERFIGRHCPRILRAMLQPLLTLLITLPLALAILAPVGSYIGTFMADVFIWLYNTFGFLGVAVIAALWPFLIMMGMHQALTPYALNSFATLGYEPIVITCSVIHNFTQGGACAAVGLKSKNPNIKAVALSCSASAIVGGISEPAVYGVSVKYKTPLYCAMFANFIAGAIVGLNHVYAMVLGGGGIFGLPVFVASDPRNLIWAVVGCVAGTIISFVATLIVYKEPATKEQTDEQVNTGLKGKELSVN